MHWKSLGIACKMLAFPCNISVVSVSKVVLLSEILRQIIGSSHRLLLYLMIGNVTDGVLHLQEPSSEHFWLYIAFDNQSTFQ